MKFKANTALLDRWTKLVGCFFSCLLYNKVLLNNIWDYKYILALFASLIWISQFDFYTRGDENIFKFINGENRQMVTGLLAGISTILFIKQLVKYYSSIKSEKAPRTETCGP